MKEREFLADVLRGEVGAIAFCELLGSVSQTWDDLFDRDTDASKDRVNAAFFNALIVLPRNPFYQRHFDSLHPLLEAAAMDWMSANDLEQGSEHDRTLAFVLRDSLVSVVIRCAAIVGGYEWAIARAAEIRRFFHDETLEQYIGGKPS